MEHFCDNLWGWFDYQDIYTNMVNEFDNAHFVEIGVQHGCSTSYMAVEIINSGKNIKFDAIDCVFDYEPTDKNYLKFKEKNPDYHPDARFNLKPVKDYVTLIQSTAQEQSRNYEDESLDFVFFDTEHTYEDTKSIIECYYNKIKIGGYIAGHDCNDSWPGVEKAVKEFCDSNNLEYVIIKNSFLIKKLHNIIGNLNFDIKGIQINTRNTEWPNYEMSLVNKISPTMCLAKWLQTTVHLSTGFTHSCHHPVPHKIDIESIKYDYKKLHNTDKKIKARKDLLNGIQTEECDFCWRIENLNKKNNTISLSDRIYKSSSDWAITNIQNIIDSKLGENIDPTYLEIDFNNICNCACMYCLPDISSRNWDEIKKYGPYKLPSGDMNSFEYLKQECRIPIKNEDKNEYINAFWKWWPELYQNLHTFRITGGEPLLSKNTWKILEYIKNIDMPNTNLNLVINTNMCIKKELLDKLIYYAKELKYKVKTFDIFTSCEAHGKQAEYIRYGMNYGNFINNVKYYLDSVDYGNFDFMSSFNILSVTTFTKFLDDFIELKDIYNKVYPRIRIGIPYIRWPEFMCADILPDNIKQKFTKELIYYYKNKNLQHFEIDLLERVISIINVKNEKQIELLKDFKSFYNEYDKRKNLNFINTFPELKQLYL